MPEGPTGEVWISPMPPWSPPTALQEPDPMSANGYRDYFKVLEVERGADIDTIKRSFRRLARQYHPDVNPGDKTAEARFKEISEA